MLLTWSVECGAEDPVIVVPWADPDDPAGARFVDLRENPYELDQIAEAEQHPPLTQALRALNAMRSPVFTSKCDAWPMDAGELEAAHHELDPLPAETPNGFMSYIDLIWRERTPFVSFHLQEQLLHRLARLLEPLDHPYAFVDCVLRPALVDLTVAQEGFAVTLYVKALGTDAPHAYEQWARALEAVVPILRGREMSLA
jgi:hypothetical protein